MANEIIDAVRRVWEDGDPLNPTEPVKSEIRGDFGQVLQDQFDLLAAQIADLEDTVAAAVHWITEVRVATTANVTLATGFENGDTIDGVVLATGNRILIKDQTAKTENGFYTVNASGAPTRTTDADTPAELTGATAFVREGTANKGKAFTCKTADITIGVTDIEFALVSEQTTSAPGTLDAIRANGSNIASAATTDIGAATGDYVNVTGTTTITSLGTAAAGVQRVVTFTGALILTHNGTSLILPNAANITTANGDTAIFRSLGSGNWKLITYQKANGSPLGVIPIVWGGTGASTAAGAYDNLSIIGSNIASATTMEAGTIVGNYADVTGTTDISSLGTTGAIGIERTLRFQGVLTLIHGAITLPGSTNLVTAAGDFGRFRKTGAGTWRCVDYFPFNGLPLATVPLTKGGTGQITAAAADDALSIIATDIASAATTDIGAAAGNFVEVTGTTTITSFGSTGAIGIERTVRFTGALILTNNANIFLPTGANITTALGDVAVFRKTAASAWRCTSYSTANGLPLATVTLAKGGTGQTTANAAFDALSVIGSNIASAATTDLGTIAGNYADITGTTTITSFGSTGAIGIERTVRFQGILTISVGGGGITLPTGADIVTAAGDIATFRKTGASTWRCTAYMPISGQPIATVSLAKGGTGATTLMASNDVINAKGADIASAATTDLSTATGNFVDVTGTTTITALGTASAGALRTVRFTGILTLTHNGTSLILPGAANITTAAGDVAIFRSLGSGNWVCISYSKASGATFSTVPIASGGTGQVTAVAGLDALSVKGADIASATTTNLAAATGDFVDITGTTTITGLGTATAGVERTVRFTGILTLTHNATSLILPGGANITTAAGDTAIFRSLGSGNWRAIAYSRATGRAVIETAGVQSSAGVADAAKILLLDSTGHIDATMFDPLLTRNAISKRASGVAAAATLNLDTANGDYVPVTGNTGISAVTLADGDERWVIFTGTPLITVGASLVGNNGGSNIQIASGDVGYFRGEGAGLVRFRIFKAAPGTAATAGVADAGKNLVLDSTGHIDASMFDPLLTRNAVSKRATGIASAATLDLDSVNGDYVPVTGSTGISAVTLTDGDERWVIFTGTPLITVGTNLRGNGGGSDIQVTAGSMGYFRGEGSGVVRFSIFQATPSISVSAGASDAGKLVQLDSNGQFHYSTLSAPFSVTRDEGPLAGAGDGVRALFALIDDGKGTLRGPFMDKIAGLAKRNLVLPKIYLLGDSRNDRCSDDGRIIATEWLYWALARLRGRADFQPSYNIAVAGSSSEDMISQALSIKDAEPGIVIIIDSTNDRTGTGLTAARTIEHLQVVQKLVTEVGGHRLIWFSEMPRGDGITRPNGDNYGLSGTQLAYHFQVAQWIRDQSSVRNVAVADPWKLMADPTDASAHAYTGLYYDGLHNGSPGGELQSRSAYEILDKWLTPRNVLVNTAGDLYSSANFPRGNQIGNGLLTGTSGSFGDVRSSGSLATGWTANTGTGMTTVCSKVPASDGGPDWQQMVIDGAPTAVTDGNNPPLPWTYSAYIDYPLTKGNFSASDIIEGNVEFELDAGHQGLRAVAMYIVWSSGGIPGNVVCGEPRVQRSVNVLNMDFPDVEFKGILQVPRATLPTLAGGGDSISVRLLVSGAPFNGSVSPNAVDIDATIRWRFASVRKVV